MSFAAFSQEWLPLVESTMRALLTAEPAYLQPFYGMMRYHLGWEDARGQPESAPQGKRIRPLLVLMSALAAGGEPDAVLPAAAAVELLHNFSLIHDDIEDASDTRRHRPCLWTWAGVPQAINTGDGMFTVARLAMHDLLDGAVSPARALWAMRVFDQTSLRLTEGQFLDMDFEKRRQVSLETYVQMISGKTAALLAASAQLGPIIVGAAKADVFYFRQFGYELGIAFQIQDDILGIWGDAQLTGKSVSTDLLTRKKTLPVLFALSQPGRQGDALRAIYAHGQDPTPDDLPDIVRHLDALNAGAYAEQAADEHLQRALAALDAVSAQNEGHALLREGAQRLAGRQT